MRRLLLLRHGKADRHSAGGDRERPLTRRGMEDSRRIGQFLRDEDVIPGLAVASNARRAKQTLERVLEAAHERGRVLKLNAHPDRLDLDDRACRMAKDAGVRIAISTDAHRAADLDLMRFGVGQARRGWLEPEDVVNTRPIAELRRLLRP
jgi:histidinol phosphatase-like PHP family hydrolase